MMIHIRFAFFCRNTLVFLILMGMLACSGAIGADDDGRPEDAALFFQDVPVSDSLDQAYKDEKDWRRVRFVQDVNVTVSLVMAPAEENNVTGRLGVFNAQIQPVGQRDIQPGLGTYEIRFQAYADTDYFILVESKYGKADYRLSLRAEVEDPCAACGPGQECRDGRCVQASACQSCPDGKVCDEEIADCVWPRCVSKRCRRGTCNRKGRCVGGGGTRITTPKCRRDTDCSGEKICRSGRCVRRPPPPCPSGQKRISGVCQEPEVEVQYEKVRANVVHVGDAGSGYVYLELDKGYSRGLKLNMTGTIRNRTLKLVYVDRFRARGKVKGKVDDYNSGQQVLFRVEKRP